MAWSRADDVEWDLHLGYIHFTQQGAEGCKARGESISYALLPALWTYDTRGAGETWIWDPLSENEDFRARQRWMRVHAFDLEATILAGFVGATVGVSFGELLDFLLGWFGLDIAGDDRPLSRWARRWPGA